MKFPGLGVTDARTVPGQKPTKRSFPVSAFTINASIVKKSTDESFDVQLIGLAVSEWEKSNFYRQCFSDCAHFETNYDSTEFVARRDLRRCAFRDGLIGRTVLEDNPRLNITLKHGSVEISFDKVEEEDRT